MFSYFLSINGLFSFGKNSATTVPVVILSSNGQVMFILFAVFCVGQTECYRMSTFIYSFDNGVFGRIHHHFHFLAGGCQIVGSLHHYVIISMRFDGSSKRVILLFLLSRFAN